jgi:hypothetical protein
MNDVVRFMHLFAEFRAASWDGWRTVLARLTDSIREVYFLVGRGSGKSRIVSMIGAYHGTRKYPRATGESIVIAIIAPSRSQALVTFRYLRALLRSAPVLASLVVRETADTIWLSTGCVIEVISASAWSPRGRTFGCVLFEEACFFDVDESSAAPISELIRAVRPRLVPGGRLYFVSSPFAPAGPMHDAEQKYAGQPDRDAVFIRKPTWELNPLFDRALIEREYREDPVAAATEFGAEWRVDGAGTFLTPAAIEAVVVSGRRELAPDRRRTYHAFVDLSSGAGGDSATLAIGHGEMRRGEMVCVVDLLREWRPPFIVTDVCREAGETARRYGIELVVGDQFGSEYAVTLMRDVGGVTLWPSNRSRSELYLELLPAVNAKRIELLDDARLQRQLSTLRRRTGRSGREHVDHQTGQHDDLANVIAGVAFEVLNPVAFAGGTGRRSRASVSPPTWSTLATPGPPGWTSFTRASATRPPWRPRWPTGAWVRPGRSTRKAST